MTESLPPFRFHPDPVATGAVRPVATGCPVCRRTRDAVYVGPFYATEDVEGICPWCIASGEASRLYDGEFVDVESVEPVGDPALLDELVHRTPGYASWQQEEWPAHCDAPCVYRGPFGRRVFRERQSEVEGDLREAGIPPDWLAEYPEEADPVAMLDPELHMFECLICGRARATGYYS